VKQYLQPNPSRLVRIRGRGLPEAFRWRLKTAWLDQELRKCETIQRGARAAAAEMPVKSGHNDYKALRRIKGDKVVVT
jgi:hypothetical protein